MSRKIKIENDSSPLVWWEELVRGKRTGLIAESLKRAARLGSWGYGLGVRSREAAYQKGLLSVKRLPRPTVCVGNITVGGTGKTPLVMRLVQDLQAVGLHPAILLRGYKREDDSARSVIVRGPDAIYASLKESGDEAMELAQRLPGVCVGVGANRFATGSLLLKRFPIDCFVMDDGFQHYQLHRDLNIVTLDVTDPWGGGQLLPAGLLRESPEALRRADLVMLTRVGLVSPDRLRVLRAEIDSFTRPGTPILESRHEPKALVPLNGTKEQSVSRLRGRSVLAISGIAKPQSFEAALAGHGAEIAASYRLRDHAGHPRDIWRWVALHRRATQWVLITEKDLMRWSETRVPADIRDHAYALRMELLLSSGRDVWQKMIKRLAAITRVV
jgi:tetraacyldisaccharide 4'-kinase